MISIGIDPSTWTGIVRIEGTESVGKVVNFKDFTGWKRLHLIAEEVTRTLKLWSGENTIVTIEDYVIGHVSSVVKVVEIGTVLRYSLFKSGINWYEVKPSTLKKWCTGKGNAKKPDMALAVKERWGYSSPSDDIVDAYCLAKLGEHVCNNGVGDLKGVHLGF
jgi:crossover junction endodeoxyribonuclease RuvC